MVICPIHEYNNLAIYRRFDEPFRLQSAEPAGCSVPLVASRDATRLKKIPPPFLFTVSILPNDPQDGRGFNNVLLALTLGFCRYACRDMCGGMRGSI